MRSHSLRPGDSLTAPRSGFVDELQVLGFPHTCHPSYGGLASTPAGLTFLLNTLALIGHTQYLDHTGSNSGDAGRVQKSKRTIKRSPPLAMEVKILALEALESGLSWPTPPRPAGEA